MNTLTKLAPSIRTHGVTTTTYQRLMSKIKHLINKAPIERIGDVLNFNVRLDEAIRAKSTSELKRLEQDLDNFAI